MLLGANNFACTWTFVIPTYLVCNAPGQAAIAAPNTAVSCGATLNGRSYDLSKLTTYDLSAYTSSGAQYIYRPCAPAANAFCQSTAATFTSQMCAIPQVCTSPSSSINVTSVIGPYSASAATWTTISNGLQVQQSSGQNCTAVCGGNVLYSGPMQSVVQFLCASGQSAASSGETVSVGSYDSSCNAVNGGSCTVTFTSNTPYACSSATSAAASTSSAVNHYLLLAAILIACFAAL